MTIKEAFERSELLGAASPKTRHSLEKWARLIPIKHGRHLFHDKDIVTSLYIVADGLVGLYKLGSTGEKRVVFIYGPGQTLNEVIVNHLPASIHCETLRDSHILALPLDQVLLAMEMDFGLSRAMMNAMSLKIRRLYHQLKNTANSLRGDKKIAAKLWKLSKDYGVATPEGIEIDFDLTITYFADMLGSKRETVSRQIKILSDAGLILFRNNRFIIPDRDALMRYHQQRG